MGQVIKKENIVISIREYTDNTTGQQKKVYKTVGELVTMRSDDGTTYQFGEMWGPTGANKFNIYEQQEKQTQNGTNNTQNGSPNQNQGSFSQGYNNNQEPPF